MNGSGCKSCPVKPCHTLFYRGSYCLEQRAKHGLGDPKTIVDRIQAMSVDELAKWLLLFVSDCAAANGASVEWEDGAVEKLIELLQQPAQENGA